MATKLPVVGSTAATTAFCSARVDGPGGLHLFVDGNGKVTSHNGTLLAPVPNAFSLVQIETCPGSTAVCRSSCYVHSLETAQKSIHDLYHHNTTTIAEILGSIYALSWVATLARWIRENASGGFRFHVSGDVYSARYARFIVETCKAMPDVPAWIYTRSFGAGVDPQILAILAEVATVHGGNLALNLSADADNFSEALRVSCTYGAPGQPLRLCYLTTDGTLPRDEGGSQLLEGDIVFPDYQLRPRQFATLAESPWWQTLTPHERGLVCPVDSFGKSEKRRCGPCAKCLT